MKVLHSVCQQIWKSQQWPQEWKRLVSIPNPKKGSVKECSNYHTNAFISHASKVRINILQARLQQYVSWELAVFKLYLEKAEEPEVKLPTSCWIIKRARVSEKYHFCFTDWAKDFVPITTNCGEFFKKWEYQTPLPASWEICIQV